MKTAHFIFKKYCGDFEAARQEDRRFSEFLKKNGAKEDNATRHYLSKSLTSINIIDPQKILCWDDDSKEVGEVCIHIDARTRIPGLTPRINRSIKNLIENCGYVPF